jgi:hypothetical protein
MVVGMGPFRTMMALAALLLVILPPLPGEAQEGDALRFFQQNPGSARLLFRQAPRPQPAARSAPRPRREFDDSYAVRRRAAPPAETLAQETLPVAPTHFVHVVGDSLSDSLANGLKEHLATEKPEISVLRKGKSSSGLVRDDFHNWPAALREMLAGTEQFDLVVMMVGSNDRQQLRDETGTHEFRSDRWRDIYVKRVDDVIAALREKRVPLLWVGMPVMESQRLSADMLFLNEIYKERASRAGVPYVDVWEAFVGDQNQYVAAGPDVNGGIVRLRTSDGIHFTRSGARKLGFFTSRDVAGVVGGGRAPTAVAALPQDLSEQIRRDTPGVVPQSLQGALPLPEELPTLPVIRERPLQGPVIELTGAPATPGAQLVLRRVVAPANEMSIMVEQVLAYGRQPPSKPGRADDFRWPGERRIN